MVLPEARAVSFSNPFFDLWTDKDGHHRGNDNEDSDGDDEDDYDYDYNNHEEDNGRFKIIITGT